MLRGPIPGCALCFWGIALALGPTINSDMDRRASERERAYIAALATRRHAPPPQDRDALDERHAQAMELAAKLAGQAHESKLRQPRYAILQQFRALPYFTGVRFGHWQEILSMPRPAPDLFYALGVWHYARGMAHLRQGQAADARRELRQLEHAASRPQLERYRLKNINPVSILLGISVHLLRGRSLQDM